MYSAVVSKEVTGVALKKHATQHKVVLAIKVFQTIDPNDPNSGGLSRKHIMDLIPHLFIQQSIS